jgi:ABC-2 type transport system ATP-binding protein
MIEALNICKQFDNRYAVDSLSLVVSRGEIYGLVGPDGAGKTTTLRLLCGALRLTSGEIHLAGHDISKQTEQARAKIGYLPQRFSLYEDLTVMENLRFFAGLRGLKSGEWLPRCMEILEFVGIEQFIHRRTGHLSGGMKQKLGLAAALVHSPPILVLDEPTSGVDPITRQDFWKLIIRLAYEEKVAVLVTTPYMDEAVRCTKVGFIQQGRLLVEGTPSELRSMLEGRIVELYGAPLESIRSWLIGEQGVEDIQMFGDRLHIRLQHGLPGELIPRLGELVTSRGGVVYRLRPVAPNLEDVFMNLMGKKDG